MSTIDRLLDPIPIPRLVKVRQSFERPQVADVAGELAHKLGAAGDVRPGEEQATGSPSPPAAAASPACRSS